MKRVKSLIRNAVLGGCLCVSFQITKGLADRSAIDLGPILNGFGFSVQEACSSDEDNGKCWLLSIFFVLEYSQKYGLRDSDFHAKTSRSIRNNLALQLADKAAQPDGQPAHWRNALLAQEWGLTILTIEVTEQGLLHIVLTTPSDSGYEQDVIFYGETANLFSPDLAIAETLQQLLLTSDISLVLTPGHVQPVILASFVNHSNERQSLLSVQTDDSPAKLLMLSELMSHPSGINNRLRPDFSARYGAARQRRQPGVPNLPGDVKETRAEKHKTYKATEYRRQLAKRSAGVIATVLAVGAGYYYREPIDRFIQPYWNKRAYYFEATTETLKQWGVSLKDYSGQFMTTAYPYWVSAKKKATELLNRYYLQRDTSTCTGKMTVSVRAAEDGSYRTKGVIADKAVDLLIDSGASSVSISAKTAGYLGYSNFVQTGVLMTCHTASHMNIDCYRIILPFVQVGCIKLFNVDATVMDSENHEILLGMSFLNRLSWTKRGRYLELEAD